MNKNSCDFQNVAAERETSYINGAEKKKSWKGGSASPLFFVSFSKINIISMFLETCDAAAVPAFEIKSLSIYRLR